MKQALKDNSISPCLVDDYRYLNKGIPNFFDYNIKDNNESKERQDEKENLKAEMEKDKQDSDELKHSEIDTKDTQMSDEPLKTLDKDKQAMSEAIKKDIAKDKENLARVEADKDEKGYEKETQSKRYANVNGWVRFRDSISLEKKFKRSKTWDLILMRQLTIIGILIQR
ncbi:hypothetical protein VN0004_00620 [Helicobacter pylori]